MAESPDLAVQGEMLSDVLGEVVEQRQPLVVEIDPDVVEDAQRPDRHAVIGADRGGGEEPDRVRPRHVRVRAVGVVGAGIGGVVPGLPFDDRQAHAVLNRAASVGQAATLRDAVLVGPVEQVDSREP